MVKTRNYYLEHSFDGAGWTAEYDNYLAFELRRFSAQNQSLEKPSDFNYMLSQVACEAMRECGFRFSAKKIKERINELRNRFFAFNHFIQFPGVTYNYRKKSLTIDREYWVNLQRQKVQHNSMSVE